MTSKAREIGAFALWVPVAIAFAASYLLALRYVFGVRLGLEGVGYVVTLPGGLLAFAFFIWLPFFIFRRRSARARLGVMGAAAAAVIVAVVLVPFCGFSCFGTQGSERYLAMTAMGFVFIGAFFHDRISRAFLKA
ncbi:hypothetical protein MNBD_ALPHA09-489 [hydrothermal vent metagenome]|uniref:Uncharacterized protein n=1 Tax=hydrothermal vent metagenome TaxID=652676 RepID=A0A3B0TMQ4_9ZZZZ